MRLFFIDPAALQVWRPVASHSSTVCSLLNIVQQPAIHVATINNLTMRRLPLLIYIPFFRYNLLLLQCVRYVIKYKASTVNICWGFIFEAFDVNIAVCWLFVYNFAACPIKIYSTRVRRNKRLIVSLLPGTQKLLLLFRLLYWL